jgi:D-aminoacyl-tRNA deacylase
MQIALISSKQDAAGVNIRDHLLTMLEENGPWPLAERHTLAFHEVAGRLIHQDRIDATVDADLILFISRHSSAQPMPALTVHVTGNFETAELGGEARSLAPAAPDWMHAILRHLAANAPAGYRVSYEVTHHGPTAVSTPSLFVEIGSTAAEWSDPAAGKAVAESILSAEPGRVIPLIGFGGTHYAVRQTEIALRSRAAFGHIMPTRQIGALDPDLLRRMQEASRAAAAYLDKKALSTAEVERIEQMLDEAGLIRLSETEILDIGEVDWKTYLRIRRLADELLSGSRVHVHNLRDAGRPVPVAVNPDLVEEIVKINKERFLGVLEGMPVVHLSKGPIEIYSKFIAFQNASSRLANDLTTLCVKLLLTSENTVIDGDHLVLRKVRFDPEKARKLGVPKGPLFSMLAGGKTVEIEGRRITPDMVQTISVRCIHIPGLERYT